MICTTCGEEKEYLIQFPVTVAAKDGKFYTREGYKSNGQVISICFDCLQLEVEEVL